MKKLDAHLIIYKQFVFNQVYLQKSFCLFLHKVKLHACPMVTAIMDFPINTNSKHFAETDQRIFQNGSVVSKKNNFKYFPTKQFQRKFSN